MSTPHTHQEGTTQRLLRRIVGRSPDKPIKPPSKLLLALWALVLPLWAFGVFASWGEKPLLANLYTLCFLVSCGALPVPINFVYRRSSTLGDLLSLTQFLLVNVGMVLFIAHFGLSGQEGWFWYGIVVFALVWLLYATWGSPTWGSLRSDGSGSGREADS